MADEEKKPEETAPVQGGAGDSGKPPAAETKPGAESTPQAASPPAAEKTGPAAPPAAPPAAAVPPQAAKPAVPGAPAGPRPVAPAAAGGKPAAAAPPRPAPIPVPKPEPWDDDFSRRVRENLGDAVSESLKFLGQNYFVVDAARISEVCGYLRDAEEYDYLVDLTAVDYPKREKRFEIIYQLYSFERNVRLRLKAPLGESESIASVVPLWSTANWLEREVYDMFGVRFDGHPDLKRILLPEDWQGYPLRKDYSIIQQDTQWVQENLHIESGQ